jgi:hypothetical protein
MNECKLCKLEAEGKLAPALTPVRVQDLRTGRLLLWVPTPAQRATLEKLKAGKRAK